MTHYRCCFLRARRQRIATMMKPMPPTMPVAVGPMKGFAAPTRNMVGAEMQLFTAPCANTAGRQLFARRVSQLNRQLKATQKQHIAKMPRIGQPE